MDLEFFSGEGALFEPHRLAIVLLLAAEPDRVAGFTALRGRLHLTDGNLNRHLHRLASEGLVEIRKVREPGGRSRTLVALRQEGRRRLRAFSHALTAVAETGCRLAQQVAAEQPARPGAGEDETGDDSASQSGPPMIGSSYVGPVLVENRYSQPD